PLFYRASQEVLRRHPDTAGAEMNCIWYRLVIEKDPTQLEAAEEFLKRHPGYVAHVCDYAIRFMEGPGCSEDAKAYRERLSDWHHLNDAATEERGTVLAADRFLPHDIPPESVERLVAYFKEHPIISQVYLAKKDVKYMLEYPSYVIGYKVKPKMFDSQQ